MMHWSLRRQSSWVQLAGHQGNFQVSKVGEVLKMHSKPEAKCLERLMRDTLRPFVPQYHGLVTRGEHCYIRLEDLLHGLRRPVIMDCKMGVRTFQEEELIKARTKPTPRSDLYHKMVKLDSLAPTEEEHTQQGVTKWRYLQWRDVCSGHQDRRHHDGGRKRPAGFQKNPDFNSGHRSITVLHQESAGHTGSSPAQSVTVTVSLSKTFPPPCLLVVGGGTSDVCLRQPHLVCLRAAVAMMPKFVYFQRAYHSRLLDLKDALRDSSFFRTHEVIGSSLLFVHDHNKASVWMIDFGKTTPLPDAWELQHTVPWTEGSREDGYLMGLTSLIASLSQAISMASGQQEDSCVEEQCDP
ncbi:inositol-trisphosphate 3-kinase A [Nothobranchius furzeri]